MIQANIKSGKLSWKSILLIRCDENLSLSLIFLSKTHNPNLIMRKTSDKLSQLRDILETIDQ